MFSLIRNLKVVKKGLFACLLLCLACNSDEPLTGGRGFRISLTDEVSVTSRSTPVEIGKLAAKNFHLLITRLDKEATIYDGAYTSGLIEAPVGTYRLRASFGNNALLAVDSPYYEGVVDTELAGDAETPVTIPCSVANALLSVRYVNQAKFEELYSSYGVKVEVDNLYIRLSGAESKSAYFRAGSGVKVSFYATLKDGGKSVSSTLEATDFPSAIGAADHIILSLSAQPVTSGTILTVDKVEIEKATVQETIPVEWLPKPKVSGFEGGATSFTYTETADVSSVAIRYTASMPVQDVEFALDFQDEQYMALNKTYTLSMLGDEDRATLTDAGITVPTLDGTSTDGVLDLTGLTANLRTNAGAEVVNQLSLRVKANNRWSSEDGEVYTIRTIKPEFTVNVQDVNCWSKEFTVDEINVTSGNADKIKGNLVYQYSTDEGSTWQECNNVRRQAFSSIPANKNYKVRACYRGCIHSNIANATLETPLQLPNSDMESWQANKVGKTGIFGGNKDYYDFLPYKSGETDIWWATNNERSRDYSVSAVVVTTSPCVSYNENSKHGGNRSALLYTSGHGGGYASTGSLLYPAGAFAGSLFVGTYSWSGEEDIVTTGHSFAVRPQEFAFWYKYIPKNSDQFKAYIELRSGDEIIATGTFIPTAYSTADSDFKQATVLLEYITLEKKATSVYVQFLSTTKTSFSSSDFDKNKSITFPVMGSWNAHIGSMLYIDDISLNYTK